MFQQIIIERLKRQRQRRNQPIRPKEIQREARILEVEIEHNVSDYFSLLTGVLAAAFGLEGFLIPNGFIDGGITGISLIVSELTRLPLSILIVVFNLPFLILGFTAIGKRFVRKSILGIALLALVVAFIHFPVVTEDPILVAAFGGFFLGLGIGLAIRGGAILDGTEVLAIYLSRKTSLTVGNIILIFNLFIFLSAAYLLSTEIALYAILTYYAASKTVDFVIDGIEEYIGATIISERSEEIRRVITDVLGRGCTLYRGFRGYAQVGQPLKEINIVYTVMTRLELAKFKTEIDKVDQDAFIIMSSIKDTKGGMIRRKPIKKIK